MDTVSYIVMSSPSCYTSVMKQNTVKFISEKFTIRIMNSVYKVKLQDLAIKLCASLRSYHKFRIKTLKFFCKCEGVLNSTLISCEGF